MFFRPKLTARWGRFPVGGRSLSLLLLAWSAAGVGACDVREFPLVSRATGSSAASESPSVQLEPEPQGERPLPPSERKEGVLPSPQKLASTAAWGEALGEEELSVQDGDAAEPPSLASKQEEQLRADSVEADPEWLHPQAFLGALGRETVVYEAPSARSKVLGYVRTGTLLRRALVPARTEGCKGGWYRVEPQGYVCVGTNATLDLEHPILQVASYQPDRAAPLPYVYGRGGSPPPALYTRIPTVSEQKLSEPDRAGLLRRKPDSLWSALAQVEPPSLLANQERVPRLFGYPRLAQEWTWGQASRRSAFAFIDFFQAEERLWGLTTELQIVPLDRLTPIESSAFEGVRLGPEDEAKAVAFTRSRGQGVYAGEPTRGALNWVRKADFREGFILTGRHFRVGGTEFYETQSGQFLKQHDYLVRIELRQEFPHWVKEETSWLDVSLDQQTLVAYEGRRPVFATLISAGRDGTADPETTWSTVQGLFRIHTKHLTSTMSGDEADDEYELRDIPYVQYFHGGYALHAAFWHDGFGTPRSHGCINLSPLDARYLFTWSDPPVPFRWHSALSTRGTLIFIHP